VPEVCVPGVVAIGFGVTGVGVVDVVVAGEVVAGSNEIVVDAVVVGTTEREGVGAGLKTEPSETAAEPMPPTTDGTKRVA
jgi:hypothetical protein